MLPATKNAASRAIRAAAFSFAGGRCSNDRSGKAGGLAIPAWYGARNEKAALCAALSGAGDAYAAGLLERRAAAAVAAFVATAAAALKFVSAISTACFVAF